MGTSSSWTILNDEMNFPRFIKNRTYSDLRSIFGTTKLQLLANWQVVSLSWLKSKWG
jgi:hypothetical protein